MQIDLNNVDVKNNAAAQRFEAKVNGQLAVAEYRLKDGTIVFTHTEVPEELEGQGLGEKIVEAALEHARAEQLQVIPLCSFVASYIRRHAAYQELVHPDFRSRVQQR